MNRIQEIRKERGMTQKELGAKIGIPQNNLSRYETGKRQIRLNDAAKIAKECGVTIDELIGDPEDEKETEE